MTRLGVLLAFALPILATASPTPADASLSRHAHGRGHLTCRTLSPSRERRGERRAAGCVAGAKKREPRSAPVLPRDAQPVAAREPSDSTLARAAAIAKVLATPCQNGQLTPEAGDLALVRQAVLCLINKQRAQHGENPLRANAELEQAAEGHAQEMISADYFDHVSPSGETPVGRVRATGYISSPTVGYVIGENLAWGTLSLATPEAIVAAWIASPGHLANILESQYHDTGIGVAPQVPALLADGAPGATYAQEFGVIIQ